MKLSVVVLVAVAIVAVSAAKSTTTEYTTKYDDIDLDRILENDRLFKSYTNCLMDRGNCTPEGKELKSVLPDAIENGCEKCNEKQKAGAEKMIRFLVNKKPAEWKELADKYDPDVKYRSKWESKAAELGIKA